jgi:acetoin utilization deacetylase AcuC-like enzyme
VLKKNLVLHDSKLIQEQRFVWQERVESAVVITVYSEDHRHQSGRAELIFGELVPCYEKPLRAETVLSRVRAVGLGDVVPPNRFGREPLLRVHDPKFLEFLETAWDSWVQSHGEKDALPMNWPVRTLRQKEPGAIDGRLGYYCLDAATPITRGTWAAATAAADTAITAASLLSRGERGAFALTRPPGHHAAADLYGGYCFLNNAAIAAQSLLDGGALRVAILDVDYHHGNGTQSIFYSRGDVLFVSIHGDPVQEFPYFLGYADETGEGEGEGTNVNLPLPWGTESSVWLDTLSVGAKRIDAFAPDALVVSLGLDTYSEDPVSRFRLDSDDYLEIGRRIGKLGLPTVFVLEGGYAVDALGANAVNVLSGFETR